MKNMASINAGSRWSLKQFDEMLKQYNLEHGTYFHVSGAYGYWELWHGGNRLETGSFKELERYFNKAKYMYPKASLMGTNKYASIVFFQGEEAEEPLRRLTEQSPAAALRYMKQWDNGEYYDIRNDTGAGTSDKQIKIGDYIIIYNTRIGYIGLSKIISEISGRGKSKYMTKKQVEQQFKELFWNGNTQLQRDLPMQREQWSYYVDSLVKDGLVSQNQWQNWGYPHWFKKYDVERGINGIALQTARMQKDMAKRHPAQHPANKHQANGGLMTIVSLNKNNAII